MKQGKLPDDWKKGIEKEGTLNDSQHGFRKQRSCETQLLATVNNFAQ